MEASSPDPQAALETQQGAMSIAVKGEQSCDQSSQTTEQVHLKESITCEQQCQLSLNRPNVQGYCSAPSTFHLSQKSRQQKPVIVWVRTSLTTNRQTLNKPSPCQSTAATLLCSLYRVKNTTDK